MNTAETNPSPPAPSPGFRRLLLTPVFALVLLAFTLAALLGTLFGTRATHYLVQQLVAKSTDGLQAHLQRFLEKPHLAARVNADAMHSGQVDVHSLFQRPEAWFLERHQQFPEVDDIYFGRTDGAIVGVDKLESRRVLKLTTEFPRRDFYELDADGRRGPSVGNAAYDARERDWYRAAIAKDGPAWSAIYVLQNRQALGISAAHPARDPSGRLMGVMGVNLTLQSISDYLRDHPVGARSTAYVVEPDGKLVASSTPGTALAGAASAGRQRLMASEAGDAVIAGSYQALQAHGDTSGSEHGRPVSLDLHGQTFWIYRTHYRDALGLDWRLVTVVDPAPFLSSVRQVALVTLVLGLVALLGLLLMLPGVTRRIARPLEDLAAATRRLGSGDYGTRVQPQGGVREIEDLARSFNDMSTRLAQAHQRLTANAAELEARVQARTAELSQANDAYLAARDRAQAASDHKTRFLAQISHEIRTPLNAISGLAFLLRDPGQREQLDQRLQTIESASRYVSQILDSVLDLSRIEAGRLALNAQPVDIADLVRQVVELVQPAAAAKGLDLSATVTDVPPALIGDAVRLQQILLNLVSNAVRVTARGAVSIDGRVTAADADGVVLQIDVVDTGPGLSAPDLQHIFEPYAQGPAPTGAAGLGLAIARSLAELMQGRLDATSTPGQGSRFRFSARLGRVPAHPVGDAAVRDTVEGTAATAASNPGRDAAALKAALAARPRPARVLVVDDEPINQLVAAGLLERVGIQAHAAMDGEQALSTADDQDFDLILMDITLPDTDGVAVTRRLRREGRHRATPILAFTGLAFEDDRRRCSEAGMNGFLAKPLEPPRFYAALWQELVMKPPASGADQPGA